MAATAYLAGPSLSEEVAVTGVWHPAFIDPSLDCRAATFENPTGERGRGGIAQGGRKGAPSRRLVPGERVTLADIEGPGTIRHVWMTFVPAPPQSMRGLFIEVFYEGSDHPSVSVPCLDFFGLPHGRPVAYQSALASAQEGRGFNSYVPMPFGGHARVEIVNGGARATTLYYQIDYTLEPSPATDSGYLHVCFRRDNPTVQGRDFVIADGIEGPGRFLGCNVGVRVIDPGNWYGEGEVKMYRDGDRDLPTICGTGLEDYVGSAWGLGAHDAPFAGAPLVVGPPDTASGSPGPPTSVDFVGFYRWHLGDPIMFARELRVTIQQIGMAFFGSGQEAEMEAYERTNPVAGAGWVRPSGRGMPAWGICERVDDYCATSFVYSRRPQAVTRLDVAAAVADIGRRPYEQPLPMEAMMAAINP
jgi:Protein of unknown function (DUF2961)